MCGPNVPDKGSRVGKFFLTVVNRTLFVVFHIVGLDVLREMLLGEVLLQLCRGTGVVVTDGTGASVVIIRWQPLCIYLLLLFRNNISVRRHLYLLIQFNFQLFNLLNTSDN